MPQLVIVRIYGGHIRIQLLPKNAICGHFLVEGKTRRLIRRTRRKIPQIFSLKKSCIKECACILSGKGKKEAFELGFYDFRWPGIYSDSVTFHQNWLWLLPTTTSVVARVTLFWCISKHIAKEILVKRLI